MVESIGFNLLNHQTYEHTQPNYCHPLNPNNEFVSMFLTHYFFFIALWLRCMSYIVERNCYRIQLSVVVFGILWHIDRNKVDWIELNTKQMEYANLSTLLLSFFIVLFFYLCSFSIHATTRSSLSNSMNYSNWNSFKKICKNLSCKL